MDPKALFAISYGIYAVSSEKDGNKNGQISNTVFQVVSEPPVLAVCLNKKNLTHDYVLASGRFSVSVLDTETPLTLIGRFGFKSGREIKKFENVEYEQVEGVPVLTEHTVAYLVCEVTGNADVGTHTLFTGKVIEAKVLSEAQPMTYAYYHQIKKGKEPPAAPTYSKVSEAPKTEDKKMDKYKCTVCGYIYETEKGDPDNGVPAGTPFDKIPDTWVCPICGAGKEAFEKEEI